MTYIESAIFELKTVKAVGISTAKLMGVSAKKQEQESAWIDFTIGVLKEKQEREGEPCEWCNSELYIKTIQYAKSLLAPLTPEQELREKLLDLTGEIYIKIPNNYCPRCGRKLEDNDEKINDCLG